MIIYGCTTYVKKCVKDELETIKEISKKKKKQMYMKEQEFMRQQEQYRQNVRQMQEDEQEDMESYVDPIQQKKMQNNIENNNEIEGFNSGDFDSKTYDIKENSNNHMSKENVLMRDLVDGMR